MVTQPTTDSGSLLDHIYVNFPESKLTVDVVDTYYSDHDGTYLSIPIGAHPSACALTCTYNPLQLSPAYMYMYDHVSPTVVQKNY